MRKKYITTPHKWGLLAFLLFFAAVCSAKSGKLYSIPRVVPSIINYFEKIEQQRLLIFAYIGTVILLSLVFIIVMKRRSKYEKEINNSLKGTEEKYKILFDNAAIGVAEIRISDGKYITSNKKYSEMVGYSKTELLDLEYMEITYPPDLGKEIKSMERLKRGEIKEFSMEKRLVHKNGHKIWVKLSVTALCNKNGRLGNLIVVIQDITKQRKNELELKKVMVAMEQSPVTVVITDTIGIAEYVNPAFSTMTGYNRSEVIGKSLKILNSGETDPDVIDEMWKTIRSGVTWKGEFINKKKNDELYYEEAIISPVLDEYKQITNFIAIKNDITLDKKQQQQIEESNNQLQKLNATKDKFFSIIAHDLRNPFNSILGFTDIITKKYDDFDRATRLHFLKSIHSSASNAYKLLENLLEWSRSQSGRMEFRPQEVVLGEIFESVLSITNSHSQEKNINVICNIDYTIEVFADVNMLNTIMRNLLTNAIKYTPTNGTVNITTLKKNAKVWVTVADNGVGIQKEKIHNLFRIDKKVSTEGTAQEQGTGLGLIMCKEFVEKNGGEITVESVEGEGSKFTFSLHLC